jgi:pseudouridine kinase
MDIPSLNKDKPVLVVGAATLDVVGRHSGFPDLGTSNPGIIRTSYGGVARNIAETVALLGQPVRLISAVGNDFIGRQILSHSERAGVDVSACLRVDNYRTGAYLAMLDEEGDLYYALDDMAVLKCLTPQFLRAQIDLFKESSMVFVDANLPPIALRTIFSLAKRAKVPVVADATSSSLAPRLAPYIDSIYMLTANQTETNVLLENKIKVVGRTSASQAARELVHMGAGIAVIQIGEKGVCYASSETSGHIPAVLTKIKDSTGAGDAMTATTIFALLNDLDLDESIRLGVTAASLTLTVSGAVVPNLTLEMLYENLVI